MESLLPIIIPAAVGILASLITAVFIRRSSKESNETNAFKVVTDQLFALNKELRGEVDTLKGQVHDLRTADAQKESRIELLEIELGTAKKVAQHLARYIGVLIAAWRGETPPPDPEPPIDWEKHL